MILKLALRFLTRNGKNSLLIGLLILLLTGIFFTGNTLITASVNGLRRSYIQNFTGSFVLHAESDLPLSVFGVNNPAVGEFLSIPVLKNTEQIEEVLSAMPQINRFAGQLTGVSALDVNGRQYKTLVFGVDGGSYFSIFEDIELVEGSLLETGVSGAMISADAAERIKTETGIAPEIGEPLLLSSIGSMGFRIREVPLTGIYRYRQNVNILQELMFADSATVRALNSVFIENSASVEDDEDILIDSSIDIDDLFSDFGDDSISEVEATEIDIDALRAEVSAPKLFSGDGGSWNFIMIELADKVSAEEVAAQLREQLGPLGVEVIGWRDAAGQAAMIVLVLQLLFNAGCVLVIIAGVIGMVNIFLISVFRRTGEIGTLRSIGATDGNIRTILYSENLIISFTAGTAGILLSLIIMAAVNSRRIVLGNSLLSALLGQSVFSFQPDVPLALLSLGLSLLIGLTASIYPVATALRIEPVTAMKEGR